MSQNLRALNIFGELSTRIPLITNSLNFKCHKPHWTNNNPESSWLLLKLTCDSGLRAKIMFKSVVDILCVRILAPPLQQDTIPSHKQDLFREQGTQRRMINAKKHHENYYNHNYLGAKKIPLVKRSWSATQQTITQSIVMVMSVAW